MLAQVRGDVFVARTFDNEEDFKRLDFTISEVSSRADWIKEARAQNERKLKAESANIALERLQNLNKKNIQAQKKAAQTTAKIEELSPAEGEKESGNTYFKRGEYEKVSSKSFCLKMQSLSVPLRALLRTQKN